MYRFDFTQLALKLSRPNQTLKLKTQPHLIRARAKGEEAAPNLDAVAGRGAFVREPQQDFAAFCRRQEANNGEAADQAKPPRHELRNGKHLRSREPRRARKNVQTPNFREREKETEKAFPRLGKCYDF